MRIEAKLKLDELQRKEEEYDRTTWNKRREFIYRWDELDSKLDGFVSYIMLEENNDDEIQECVEEAQDLGDNLGDYEILECVDEYD